MTHILIADPDPALRKTLSLILHRKIPSLSVNEVGDVKSMIRNLMKTPPDILLLDWNLYGSPAPEICRLLHKAYPQLRMILFSMDANDRCAANASGADFVHKATKPDEWIAAIQALIPGIS